VLWWIFVREPLLVVIIPFDSSQWHFRALDSS
jgi:hypothetical protein